MRFQEIKTDTECRGNLKLLTPCSQALPLEFTLHVPVIPSSFQCSQLLHTPFVGHIRLFIYGLVHTVQNLPQPGCCYAPYRFLGVLPGEYKKSQSTVSSVRFAKHNKGLNLELHWFQCPLLCKVELRPGSNILLPNHKKKHLVTSDQQVGKEVGSALCIIVEHYRMLVLLWIGILSEHCVTRSSLQLLTFRIFFSWNSTILGNGLYLILQPSHINLNRAELQYQVQPVDKVAQFLERRQPFFYSGEQPKWGS